MQDSVKLLITFPQSTDIQQLAQHLRSEYTFPQEVKILGRNKLSCSFETMADLLEIDFINTFGATATKVINSRSFSYQMNLKNENVNDSISNCDSKDFQSSLGQFPNGNSLASEVNIKTVIPQRRERLTSLQDEVVEDQKIRELFCLYKTEEQEDATWMNPGIQGKIEQKQQDSKLTHTSLQSQKGISFKEEESIWKPLLGGIALTSVLVGGFKLMRMVLG